jgi:hypothetical protein
MADREALLASFQNRLERDLDANLDVAASSRPPAAPEEAIEEPASAEAREVEASVSEEILEVGAREEILGTHAADARKASTVVLGALLRVADAP